jgi:hypothetical protein
MGLGGLKCYWRLEACRGCSPACTLATLERRYEKTVCASMHKTWMGTRLLNLCKADTLSQTRTQLQKYCPCTLLSVVCNCRPVTLNHAIQLSLRQWDIFDAASICSVFLRHLIPHTSRFHWSHKSTISIERPLIQHTAED